METEKAMPVGKNMEPIGKENTQPVLNFAGSSHFTLNFHVHS